jgi:hypothetical protein
MLTAFRGNTPAKRKMFHVKHYSRSVSRETILAPAGFRRSFFSIFNL